LGDSDQASLMIVLHQMARRFGGVQAMGEQAQPNPKQLYRTPSPKGNQALGRLSAILKAWESGWHCNSGCVSPMRFVGTLKP